jgi:hypothetical protein
MFRRRIEAKTMVGAISPPPLSGGRPLLGSRVLVALLSTISGGLSVSRVVQAAFRSGFPKVVEMVLEKWDRFLTDATAPLQPVVLWLLGVLSGWIDVQLSLQPHWKHILVLMFLHPFKDALVYLEKAYYPDADSSLPGVRARYIASAVSRGLFGALVAGAVAVGVGTIPLETAGFGENLALVAVPVFGFWVYMMWTATWGSLFLRKDLDLVFHRPSRSLLEDLRMRVDAAKTKAFDALLLSLGALAIVHIFWPEFETRGQAGLLTLGGLVVLLAISWIWRGTQQAVRRDGESLISAYSRVGNVLLGVQMLLAFLLPFVFIVWSAF